MISSSVSPSDFYSLSRYLKFDENEVQDICDKHREPSTRTMILLERYEGRRWPLEKLIKALIISGRSDIARRVENILKLN